MLVGADRRRDEERLGRGIEGVVAPGNAVGTERANAATWVTPRNVTTAEEKVRNVNNNKKTQSKGFVRAGSGGGSGRRRQLGLHRWAGMAGGQQRARQPLAKIALGLKNIRMEMQGKGVSKGDCNRHTSAKGGQLVNGLLAVRGRWRQAAAHC